MRNIKLLSKLLGLQVLICIAFVLPLNVRRPTKDGFPRPFSTSNRPEIKTQDRGLKQGITKIPIPGSHEDWLTKAGISSNDWGYVDYIVTNESGWRPDAVNEIGACGLVQALPCSKVPGQWDNPITNLHWAQDYALARYGSWASAYTYWQNHHNW